MIDTPIVTSCGVFEYTLEDGSVMRAGRLPEHVFCPKSLASYKGKPIIMTHETSKGGFVDTDNVRDEIVGTILSEGYRDGDNVRVEIVLHDINHVKSSQDRELSLAYTRDMIGTPGEVDGKPYDAVQTNIVIDNLAIVRTARAGEHARLNLDGKDEKEQMAEKKEQMDVVEATIYETDAEKADVYKKIEDLKDKYKDKSEMGSDAYTEKEVYGDVYELLEIVEDIIEDKNPYMDAEAEEEKEKEKDAEEVPAEAKEKLVECIEKIEAIAKEYYEGQGEPIMDAELIEELEEDEELKISADSVDVAVRERLEVMRIGERINLDGLDQMSTAKAKAAIVAKTLPKSVQLDSATAVNTAYSIAKAQILARKPVTKQYDGMVSVDGMKAPGASSYASAHKKYTESFYNGGNE